MSWNGLTNILKAQTSYFLQTIDLLNCGKLNIVKKKNTNLVRRSYKKANFCFQDPKLSVRAMKADVGLCLEMPMSIILTL